MRKIAMLLILVAAVLPGCAAGGAAEVEPAVESEPPSAAPVLESEAALPVEADSPTALPELTVVVPSGEVDVEELEADALTPQSDELQVMPAPGRPRATPSPRLARTVEAVTRDLEDRLGRQAADVRMVSTEPITWPDAALGCPAAGANYAEVQVDGTLITLEAGDQTYTYHTDNEGNFVLCQDGRPVGVE